MVRPRDRGATGGARRARRPVRAPFSGGRNDLWLYDLDRGVGSRLTDTFASEYNPVWSPDGTRIAYSTDRTGVPELRIGPAAAGDVGEVLVGAERVPFAQDWSPDGSTILFEEYSGGDLSLAPVDGSPPRPWLAGTARAADARFSPDGRWIAFESDEPGSREIFVAPVESSGRRQRVSTSGGADPVWSPSGDRIYFHDDHSVSAVPIDPATGQMLGGPEVAVRVEAPDRIAALDIHPDGTRLLLALVDEELLEETTRVQVGWRNALRR